MCAIDRMHRRERIVVVSRSYEAPMPLGEAQGLTAVLLVPLAYCCKDEAVYSYVQQSLLHIYVAHDICERLNKLLAITSNGTEVGISVVPTAGRYFLIIFFSCFSICCPCILCRMAAVPVSLSVAVCRKSGSKTDFYDRGYTRPLLYAATYDLEPSCRDLCVRTLHSSTCPMVRNMCGLLVVSFPHLVFRTTAAVGDRTM